MFHNFKKQLHNWICSLKNGNCWKFLLLFGCSLVTLKLLWRTLKKDVINCFTPFAKYFTKIKWNFSGLKQVLSICTSFHNNWLKTWLDIRNLIFLLNKELCRKFAAVLKVLPKMMSQIKYKNWHKFRSTFDFNLRFFLKVMFLESVSLNKTLS